MNYTCEIERRICAEVYETSRAARNAQKGVTA